MVKTIKPLPDTKNGTFAPAKIGVSKAAKFALVEGVRLDAKSVAAAALTQSRGLKGDTYREAITDQFRNKRAK